MMSLGVGSYESRGHWDRKSSIEVVWKAPFKRRKIGNAERQGMKGGRQGYRCAKRLKNPRCRWGIPVEGEKR